MSYLWVLAVLYAGAMAYGFVKCIIQDVRDAREKEQSE